jgi:iron complex outermembrane receptor protein
VGCFYCKGADGTLPAALARAPETPLFSLSSGCIEMIPNSPKLKLLGLCVLLAQTSAPVWAQQNTLESIVITADRQQSALRDVPASIFTVGGDDLSTVRATHISEVLARVPGTWISRNNGQESLTAIRSPVLSGAGSCGAFQMAQDGIPLRATGFCNVNQMFESNTEQAGAVEVIRGPGSILYGANALHGAINVISESISDTPDGDVSYELGPHRYNRLRATVSNTLGANGFRASFNGTSDGGYKHDSGFDQQKLSLQHRYTKNNFSVTNAIHATNLNQETAGFVQGDDAYKDDDLKRVNPNPDSFRDAESLRLSSRLQWETAFGSVMVTPYYRKTEMTFLQHFLPGLPQEENGQTSWGLMTMLSGVVNNRLHWQAGLDMETTEGYLRETQSVAAIGTPVVVATIPVGKHYDYTVDAELVSPYAQLKYDLTSSDQLSLGVRFESLEYDYDNLMLTGRTKDNGVPCTNGGCRFNRPADRSDNYDNHSVQLGWIHDLNGSSQVYFNAAEAFRAPDNNEIYRLQGTQSVADLDSEQAQSFEIGYRGNFDVLSYALAVYHMEKENVIIQDSNRINISGAKTKHRGIELNGAYPLTDALSLTVAATYARHTYEGNVNPAAVELAGLDIDTAPRVSGSAQLRWIISERRNLELEWVHVGSYFTDEANTNKYPGHDLVNLRYQADFGDNWYYGARVTNLLDTDYAERADLGFGNERYFVGEPISAYITIGQRF